MSILKKITILTLTSCLFISLNACKAKKKALETKTNTEEQSSTEVPSPVATAPVEAEATDEVEEEVEKQERPPRLSAEERSAMLEVVYSEAGLNQEQIAEIKMIEEEAKMAMMEARKSNEGDREAMRSEMKNIMSYKTERLKSIMSEEQFNAYMAAMKTHGLIRGEGGGRGQGGPGGPGGRR